MYTNINYKKLFEQATPQPANTQKELKEIFVNITEEQIDKMTDAAEDQTIFEIAPTQIVYKDGTSSNQGMLYFAFKPAGGQQSPENTQKIQQLLSTAGNFIFEVALKDTHTLSSVMDLAGDPKGELVSVIFPIPNGKSVSIKFIKADEATDTQETEQSEAEPATEEPAQPQATTDQVTPQEVAIETGDLLGANPKKYESSMEKPIKSFDDFVTESKKKWIGDVDMKKGALKKELGKDTLTAKDIKEVEKKLKKKDKDKEKPGLQLNKKDAKTNKRVNLAKNLMKASGAIKESRQEQIKGTKEALVKLHQIVEKMIEQTSAKKS